ncbi:MAG: thioredoxin domain-containing protein [Candidatus Paceibacterota bacterium]|jgi:protein-disulfide isomerase
MQNNDQKQIAGAILIVGVLIAGAILLKDAKAPTKEEAKVNAAANTTTVAPVGKGDNTIGDPNAKLTIVMYEDFQCPFCGAVTGLELNSPAMKPVMDYLKSNNPNWAPSIPEIMKYVEKGDVLFVYRDFTFLGEFVKPYVAEADESINAANAARCAGDQGKFWEFHDYLYSHQNGENEGGFARPKLKSFAKTLNLDTLSFDKCLDSNKYVQTIIDSKKEGTSAGVTGTPKGFILKNGKVVATIDGAEPLSSVKIKIDAALK